MPARPALAEAQPAIGPAVDMVDSPDRPKNTRVAQPNERRHTSSCQRTRLDWAGRALADQPTPAASARLAESAKPAEPADAAPHADLAWARCRPTQVLEQGSSVGSKVGAHGISLTNDTYRMRTWLAQDKEPDLWAMQSMTGHYQTGQYRYHSGGQPTDRAGTDPRWYAVQADRRMVASKPPASSRQRVGEYGPPGHPIRAPIGKPVHNAEGHPLGCTCVVNGIPPECNAQEVHAFVVWRWSCGPNRRHGQVSASHLSRFNGWPDIWRVWGQALANSWPSLGQVRVELLPSVWHVLVKCWTSVGQVLANRCPRSAIRVRVV